MIGNFVSLQQNCEKKKHKVLALNLTNQNHLQYRGYLQLTPPPRQPISEHNILALAACKPPPLYQFCPPGFA